MSAAATRDRLVAVLGMLGSTHDGEVINAARQAERLRRDLGATWGDLITVRSPPPPPQPDWRRLLSLCRASTGRLTPWEDKFTAGLMGYRVTPTPRQLEILAGIVSRLVSA